MVVCIGPLDLVSLFYSVATASAALFLLLSPLSPRFFPPLLSVLSVSLSSLPISRFVAGSGTGITTRNKPKQGTMRSFSAEEAKRNLCDRWHESERKKWKRYVHCISCFLLLVLNIRYHCLSGESWIRLILLIVCSCANLVF